MPENKIVYLDNASTTYCNGEVFYAMQPYFMNVYGHPNAAHFFGAQSRMAIENARAQVARLINAEPEEIFFTSGATEANNWLLKGIVEASDVKRIIISEIEHPSIIETANWLAAHGVIVEYVKVNEDGIISVPDLLAKLAKPACLVSVLTASNEVGTVQYINTIANICAQNNAYFHTDASAALDSIQLDVKEMGVTALSLSGHKIYGPKGIGALYIKKGTRVADWLHGEHPVNGHDIGTANIPAIVGLGKAVEISARDGALNNQRLKQLRDYFIREVEEKIPGVKLNGHRTQRLVNNINFSFQAVDGECIVASLSAVGVCVATGSANRNETLSRSHVLRAMGVDEQLINGSVCFSLGRSTTKEEIDYTIAQLITIIKKLRTISPLKLGGQNV